MGGGFLRGRSLSDFRMHVPSTTSIPSTRSLKHHQHFRRTCHPVINELSNTTSWRPEISWAQLGKAPQPPHISTPHAVQGQLHFLTWVFGIWVHTGGTGVTPYRCWGFLPAFLRTWRVLGIKPRPLYAQRDPVHLSCLLHPFTQSIFKSLTWAGRTQYREDLNFILQCPVPQSSARRPEKQYNGQGWTGGPPSTTRNNSWKQCRGSPCASPTITQKSTLYPPPLLQNK